MDAKLLAKIALRVLAVYIIAKGIMALPELMELPIYTGDAHYAGPSFLWIFAAVISPLIIGLFLWLIAPRAAHWIVGDVGKANLSMAVSGATLLTVAFISVGVTFVVLSLPNILGLIYISQDPSTARIGPDVFRSRYFFTETIRLFLGLLLIVGTKNLVRLFTIFREFGLVADSSERVRRKKKGS